TGVLTEYEATLTEPFTVTTTDAFTGLKRVETYDADGTLAEVDVWHGTEHHVTSFEYDDLLRVEQITHPEGAVETFEYDDEGRLWLHTSKEGLETELLYGPFDQVAERKENGEVV